MEKTKKILLGMSFSRKDWVVKLRERLEGAMGEYAKYRFAQLISLDFDWAPEVQRLILRASRLYDEKITKRDSRFDFKKATIEAVEEASEAQNQIVAAKNQFLSDYLKTQAQKDKFLREYRKNFNMFSSESLLLEMLEEFAPDILKYLK